MKKTKEKFTKFNIRVTREEEEMIKNLRDEYCINISQYVRKSLRDLSEKLGQDNAS